MNILSNEMLNANQFVEYATGKYYFRCSTLQEMCSCFWHGTGEPISTIWELKDINKVPKDAYVCFVQVSKEDNYTEHEVKIVRLYKKFVKRFLKNMNEYDTDILEMQGRYKI